MIDELERRGVLERTWVIIAADHGESFGEHPGVFWHGTSLYQTELHVPLLIIPPAAGPPPRVVTETVSLRDLAATIVDILGLKPAPPFRGIRWPGSGTAAPHGAADPAASGRRSPKWSRSIRSGKRMRMPSAAGHDAAVLSYRMPSGMMFIPSLRGISHHWSEDTKEEDIVLGAQVFADAAERILRAVR